MGKTLKRLAIAGSAVLGSGLIGKAFYTHMRYKKIKPRELKNVQELIKNRETTPEFHLTAHRGLSAVAPENTVEAFRRAGEAGGFYAFECDTHRTTDGVWVIIHDRSIRSMLDGKGKVTDFSYDELCKMKMVNGANIENYPDLKLCTLEEYIDLCLEYGVRPMIEIKDPRTEQMAEFYSILQRRGIVESCIIISFHIDILKALHEIDPSLEMWYLVEFITEKTLNRAEEAGGLGIAFNAARQENRTEWIQKVHERGLTAACWTVDSEELLNKMLDCGVKYITTNSILPNEVKNA